MWITSLILMIWQSTGINDLHKILTFAGCLCLVVACSSFYIKWWEPITRGFLYLVMLCGVILVHQFFPPPLSLHSLCLLDVLHARIPVPVITNTVRLCCLQQKYRDEAVFRTPYSCIVLNFYVTYRCAVGFWLFMCSTDRKLAHFWLKSSQQLQTVQRCD